MKLPTFKYHPDPLATESSVESDAVCVCCKKSPGYIYTDPVYATDEYVDCICPWCIADGSASLKLAAAFADEAGVGDYGSWPPVPESVVVEVAKRTPGFHGWQQERWWTNCQDAAGFSGRAGKVELLAFGRQAIKAIQDDDGPEWESFLFALNKDGSPTAYVFRCL